MVGGCQCNTLSKANYQQICQYFDIETNSWELYSPIKIARAGASSCYLKGYLYVFCGYNDANSSLNSIERVKVIEEYGD